MDQGPIADYLPLIKNIAEKIPTDHFITRTEINQLAIQSLKILFYYTFPESFSNDDYQQLVYLADLAARTVIKLPDNAIVIASGDSPSKIVNLINLLWRIDEDTYHFKYETKDYEKQEYDDNLNVITVPKFREINKRIKFITFPLSDITYPTAEARKKLPDYLRGILESRGVNYQILTNFIDLDYISSGKSHANLEASLKELNPGIQLSELNLDDLWKETRKKYSFKDRSHQIYNLIIGAERYVSRCMPSYSHLDRPVPQFNVRRCNLIVTMIYLRATDQLGLSPELPPAKFVCKFTPGYKPPYPDPYLCLYPRSFYDIEYYDLSDNIIKQIYGVVKLASNVVIINDHKEHISFPGAIIKIKHDGKKLSSPFPI